MCRNSRVLTASKDHTVKLHALMDSGLSVVHTYDELFNKTAKCARWRDSVTFAAAGNDRVVCALSV